MKIYSKKYEPTQSSKEQSTFHQVCSSLQCVGALDVTKMKTYIEHSHSYSCSFICNHYPQSSLSMDAISLEVDGVVT